MAFGDSTRLHELFCFLVKWSIYEIYLFVMLRSYGILIYLLIKIVFMTNVYQWLSLLKKNMDLGGFIKILECSQNI